MWYGFLEKYQQNGGSNGKLGFPVNGEYNYTYQGQAGRRMDFEGGWMFWSPVTGDLVILEEPNPSIPQPFLPVYLKNKNQLGNLKGGVKTYNSGIKYMQFDNGSIVTSKYGTYAISGAIRQKYLAAKGLDGKLGAPTSAAIDQGNGTKIQYFAGGYIFFNGKIATVYYTESSKPSKPTSNPRPSKPTSNPRPSKPTSNPRPILKPVPINTPIPVPSGWNQSVSSTTFSLRNQSLWGGGNSFVNLGGSGFNKFVDQPFENFLGKGKTELGFEWALFFSSGAFDADVGAKFSLSYPKTAKPGEKLRLNLSSQLATGNINTQVGASFKAEGNFKFEFDPFAPFFPSYEFKMGVGANDFIPVPLELGITTQGALSGSEISSEGKLDSLMLDTDKVFPKKAREVAESAGLKLEVGVGPVITQKSVFNVKGFQFDFNGVTSSTGSSGNNFLEMQIPANLSTGSVFNVIPKVKPFSNMLSTFGLALKGFYNVKFRDFWNTSNSLTTPTLFSQSRPSFDPFSYYQNNSYQSLAPISIQII